MTRAKLYWIAIAFFIAVACLLALPGQSPPANNFHFSILGDRTGEPQPGIYGRVWREISLLHPDFVINVGDSIQGGNDSTVEQEWAQLHPIWARYRKSPMYFVAGNHDVFSEKSRRVFERETRHPSSYGFDYQAAHFTVLDNSQADELSPAQLDFLQRDLEANKNRSPKFIFFHRPFWFLLAKVKNRNFPLHQIAKKYGVEYVISGHAHQFFRTVNDGITYIAVGSSGAHMTRGFNAGQGFKEGWFYQHIWATVDATGVQFTVKEIDTKGAGRMFNAEAWGENGANFDPADPAALEVPGT